jgi:hypothetical protein
MSKKNKAKFKRIIKAQMAQEMVEAQVSDRPAIGAEIKNKQPVVANMATAAIDTQEINLPQIKYDLKKTGIIVIILALIIALLYYLDYKYGILLTFGNWLFKVLHIG